MGVRTTNPVKGAYRKLEPDDEEASAIYELLCKINDEYEFGEDVYYHSMVLHYDSPRMSNSKREIFIPVRANLKGVKTKTLPSMRVAFLVFKGTDASVQERYKQLRDYMKQTGLTPKGDIHSIEVMYVPESVDEQDYSIEIMIPITS
jgi:effector-binding domain-containing protein